MAEIPLYGFDIIPRAKRRNGVAVSQIVKARVRSSNSCRRFFECPVNRRLCQVHARLAGKYKVTILPQRPRLQPLSRLFRLAVLQAVHDKGRCGDCPALSVFRRNKFVCLHPLILMKLHLLVDGQNAVIKVDTIPCQPQHFPLPQTGEQCDKEKIFKCTFSDLTHGDIQGALQSLRAIFETVFNQIADLVKTVFTAIWTAISDRVTKIKDSIVDGFTAAIDWIKALPAQAVQWGADIIQGIVDGIKGAVGKVGDAVSEVAGKIKSFLHFSKPDEGPLRDFDTYMPDMIDTMVKGISAGRSKVKEVVGNIASDIAGGMPDVHAEVMTTTAKGSTAGLQQIGASKDKLLDAVQALIGGIAVMAQYNAAVSPATAATVYGGNTSRTIIQNNNFHQQFNGDQAIQRKTAAATAKVSEDATAALARSLAYLK